MIESVEWNTKRMWHGTRMEMRREGGVIAWEDKEEKKKKSRYETNFNKMNFITIFYFSAELWIALGFSFKWSPVGLTFCWLNISFNVQWETFRKTINSRWCWLSGLHHIFLLQWIQYSNTNSQIYTEWEQCNALGSYWGEMSWNHICQDSPL